MPLELSITRSFSSEADGTFCLNEECCLTAMGDAQINLDASVKTTDSSIANKTKTTEV